MCLLVLVTQILDSGRDEGGSEEVEEAGDGGLTLEELELEQKILNVRDRWSPQRQIYSVISKQIVVLC